MSITISVIISIWTSFALNIPKPDWYVLDQANILTQQQEQTLENTISQARQDTDIEIWVLVINSLSWEDIFNYSLNVAESRWVGDKEKDNGLVMVFAMKDRKRRIQVWYGLEWIITDSIAKRFWEKNIPNNFKNWLYFDWINWTLQDIIKYINKDPETLKYINASKNNITKNSSDQEGKDNQFFFWAFIGLIFLIKTLVLKYDKKTKKSKIKKWGRIALFIIWSISWLLAYRFIFPWHLIWSWIFWYSISIAWLFLWILIGNWNTLLWAMLLWWRWWKGWLWWWWSLGWFWGFGWGSFWGGGGWGSR